MTRLRYYGVSRWFGCYAGVDEALAALTGPVGSADGSEAAALRPDDRWA